MAVVLERVETARGELVLRRSGDRFEVISNGTFLMDTHDGRSERQLVTAALAHHEAPGGRPRRLLLGGLGVGFSLTAAVEHPGLDRIDVVEVEAALVGWHPRHLAHLSGGALADARVRVVLGEIADHLARCPASYDVVCLDVDNGPEWTVTDGNAGLYGDRGTALAQSALAPGGVLAVWSAAAAPAYEKRLRRHLSDVRRLDVPVTTPRAAPDVVYLGRRPVAGAPAGST